MKIIQPIYQFCQDIIFQNYKRICQKILRPGVLLKNQKGVAIVELTMMMPFLAILLLALAVTHEFSSKQVAALVNIRHEMRHSMNNNASGSFRRTIKQKTISVDVPGKMKQYFGKSVISQTLKIEFYEGSYHGYGKNKYHPINGRRRIHL